MKTVKVRIAVAVDPSGDWNAYGSKSSAEAMEIAVETLEDGESRFWFEAELPVPEIKTIEPTVTEEKQ